MSSRYDIREIRDARGEHICVDSHPVQIQSVRQNYILDSGFGWRCFSVEVMTMIRAGSPFFHIERSLWRLLASATPSSILLTQPSGSSPWNPVRSTTTGSGTLDPSELIDCSIAEIRPFSPLIGISNNSLVELLQSFHLDSVLLSRGNTNYRRMPLDYSAQMEPHGKPPILGGLAGMH